MDWSGLCTLLCHISSGIRECYVTVVTLESGLVNSRRQSCCHQEQLVEHFPHDSVVLVTKEEKYTRNGCV